MAEKKGWFSKLKDGLLKSSSKLSEGISAIVTKRKLDQDMLDELEELLITADMGLETASTLIQNLSKARFNEEITAEEVKLFLAQEIAQIIAPHTQTLHIDPAHKPHVIMVVGVNGGGKTTTIGKLAHLWADQGYKVRLAAGDTFRAAAVAQLQTWAERSNVPVVVGSEKSDAASLAYSALEISQKEQDDILIIDTAGRLQNKSHLMDELSKVERVIQKLDPSAPHTCILVLDATTGQNAHSQVTLFKETVGLSGLVLTKLDGTAKGGVLVSLAQQHALPLYAIGVGEGIDDLKPFDALDFAKGLMGV